MPCIAAQPRSRGCSCPPLGALAVLIVALLSPSPSSPAFAQAGADPWAVRRSPFDQRLAARYRSLLEQNPDDAQALRKLIELYRRGPGVDRLLADYRRKLQAEPQSAAYSAIVGQLHRLRGEREQAIAALRTAVSRDPRLGGAQAALAELLLAAGQADEATAVYERALTAARPQARKPLLRALADLAVAAKDEARARTYFQRLLELEPGNLDLRGELAEALARGGLARQALAEWREVARRLQSDPPRRADALRRVGELEDETGDPAAAIATLREAIRLTPAGHYLRKELSERIVAVHRKRDDLRSLIGEMERAPRRGFLEQDTLARLYDETGDQTKAIEAYRRALAMDAGALDSRARLVAALERSGRSEEALAEYEKLATLAPGESRYQLELAERLLRGGQRNRGLAVLARSSARFPGDASVHEALRDLYARYGVPELALREAETLVRIDPSEESHIVDLGEQYYQRGNRQKAVETWRRLLGAIPRRDRACARLAEVLGEHDMFGEAFELYDKALRLSPNEPAYHRGLAILYERQRRGALAAAAWERVLEHARGPAQRALRAEARTRLIAVLQRDRALAGRLQAYRRRFDASTSPIDVDTGYLLVEGYGKLGLLADAEKLLGRILEAQPNEADAWLALVGLYRLQRRYQEAVDALARLATLLPGRAREFYSQMADLELLLYRDDQALKFATRALELAPTDAQAQERLGDIYEKKGEAKDAIRAYRKAIELNPRQFKVYFALARVLVRQGELGEASRLYREVLRRAAEDEIVLEAARKAADIDEYLGTLGELERELAPLAFTFTERPIYRRVMVEVLARYATPLIAVARGGDARAREELGRLGEHGLGPLLEALADTDPQQQRIAVALLGHLGNRAAALPLVRFAASTAGAASTGGATGRAGASGSVGATGAGTATSAGRGTGAGRRAGAGAGRAPPSGVTRSAPLGVGGVLAPAATATLDLRVEAVFAAGRLGEPTIAAQLTLLAGHREAAMREAAIWALGHGAAPQALETLLAASADSRVEVQALACLGLGRQARQPGQPRAVDRVLVMLRDSARPMSVRAACAYALGLAADRRALVPLAAALTAGRGELQRLAAWSLGRLGDGRALPPLLAAMVARPGTVREVVLWALPRASGDLEVGAPPPEEPVLDAGKVDLQATVAALAPLPRPVVVPATLLDKQADEIGRSVIEALSRHRDLTVRTLLDLSPGSPGSSDGQLPGNLSLGRLLLADDSAARRRMVGPLAATIGQLTTHRDAEIRRLSLGLLPWLGGKRAGGGQAAATDETTLAIALRALADPAAEVRQAALAAIASVASGGGRTAGSSRPPAGEQAARADQAARGEQVVKAVAAQLGGASWEERLAATACLGRIANAAAIEALRPALGDPSGFVREAAARALGSARAKGFSGPLVALLADESAEVRLAAVQAMATDMTASGREALRRASAGDQSEAVREAARQMLLLPELPRPKR